MNPPRKSRTASYGKSVHPEDTSSSEHGYDESDSNGEPIAKDETEKELERLMFGDDAGFHDALRAHEPDSGNLVTRASSESESAEGGQELDEGDLGHMDDTALFYLDTGKSAVAEKDPPPPGPVSVVDAEQQHPQSFGSFAAWEDSDDEILRISLAGNDRLRKLRLTEAEDMISGKEYTTRLRKQFERLQPAPDWACQEPTRLAKRRKTNASLRTGDAPEAGIEKSDTDDTDADERDSEELSSKPLALLLQNSTSLTRSGDNETSRNKNKLREEVLDIQRLKDVGGTQPSSIDCLSFHPHYPLLLSSGPASTVFLHHVAAQSGSANPLLTSLHVRRTPIRTCAFSPPEGNRVFLSGRRRYFHVWDLDSGKIEKVNGAADRREEQKSMERFKLSPCGRWMGIVGSTRKGGGIISVVDATTLQWISQVRVDSRGGVADFAWWRDGEGMCVVGKNGEVSEWDIRERRVIARWVDEGAMGTTVLNLGGKSGHQALGGDRWVAIGSSSGIVNIYDRRPWAEAAIQSQKRGDNAESEDVQAGIPQHPKPKRVLDQLTTPTSHIAFSNDGQLLIIASRWKRDAIKLVHLPSCTVYKNWPTTNTPLGRISSVALAPNSRALAVANEQGKIRLWEIHG